MRRILIAGPLPAADTAACTTLEWEGYWLEWSSAVPRAPIDTLDADAVIIDAAIARREIDSPGAPLVLFGDGNERADELPWFRFGYDAYLRRPYRLVQLHSTIERLGAPASAPIEMTTRSPALSFGSVSVDLRSGLVHHGDRWAQLTPGELHVLQVLAGSAGKVVGRSQLLDHVGAAGRGASPRSVDNTILGIRRKLGPEAAAARPILAVRSHGYRLAPAPHPPSDSANGTSER